jgi:hypothetical protein
MASDPQYDEPFQPEPPQKRGMSSGTKVLIILLCVFGGMALLCCGGVVYFAYKVRNAVSEDPAVVRSVANDIAEIDIPPKFEPVASMNFSMVMKMRFAIFQTPGKTGTLMLMEMAVPNASEEDMKQSMSQQGQGQNMRDLVVKKTETKTFKVRGKDVTFYFSEAVDEKTKAPYRKVHGTFPGKDGGAVVLVLQVPEKEYNEGEAVKMIKSIK